MIVACQQCHTRFKVPDGKVKARGLKVRCSRCHHTFRIYPDSASDRDGEAVAAAPRPKGPDPFEAFGPEGTSEMEKTPARGTTVSELLAQMSPSAAPATEDFDVDVSGEEQSSTEPAWNFPPAPARPAGPTAAAAVAHQPEPARPTPEIDADVSFATVPVPVRPPPPPPANAIRDVSELSFASFDPTSERVPLPVRPLPPARPPSEEPEPRAGATASEPDAQGWPDADLTGPVAPHPPVPPGSPDAEDLAALAGFTPAWGVSAPVRALSVDGSLSDHVSNLGPAAELPSPPPSPQFGGGSTVLDDLPSLEAPGAAPIPELELDSGGDARDWAEASLVGDGGVQLELEAGAGSLDLDRRPGPEPLELDRRPVPEALAAPPKDPAWALLAPGPPAAPAARSGPALSWDDPFTESPPPPLPSPAPVAPPPPAPPEPVIASPRSAVMSVVLDEAPAGAVGAPDHGFFEMPSGGPPALGPSSSLLPDVPEAEPAGAATAVPRAVTAPISAISKPPSRVRLGLHESDRPGTARQVSAVILNVGLAALLLLVVVGIVSSWATAGRVEGAALSPRRLLQVLRPGTGVTPVEVTPGTYETRSGRSLLYVRGRVVNRGAPSGRVRVRAEVWDGAQAVKTGETLAGAIATPEELWRATTPADVESLRGRLLSAATTVADGHQADFLVLLDDAPADLSGLKLRVTASIER